MAKTKRELALHRAMHWAKLFSETNYDAFMAALYPPDKNKFDAACAAAGNISDEENAWLWHYLKNADDSWKPAKVLDYYPATVGW